MLTQVGGGTSLAVKWLRLGAFTAGGMGLIPGQGTKIPQAWRCGQFFFFLSELGVATEE